MEIRKSNVCTYYKLCNDTCLMRDQYITNIHKKVYYVSHYEENT